MESIYGKGAPNKWKPGDGYNRLPDRAGEYKVFYVSEELTQDQCVYVGFSGNIRVRIQQHNTKRYIEGCSYVSYKELDVNKIVSHGIDMEKIREIIRNHERETIIRLNPADNIKSGGAGRGPNLSYIEAQLNIRANEEVKNNERGIVDKINSVMAKMMAAIKRTK
jgi:hypothetical protein